MSKIKLKLGGAKASLQARRAERAGSVLIVDDEPANLDGLAAVLGERYEVHQALSGHEALSLLERHTIDVIITDQRMPEMLGTELLQAVQQRAEGELNHLNILLTGYTDADDLISCINDGLLYRYLVKPWHPQELLATVSQAFDQLSIKRQLKRQTAQLHAEVEERRRAQAELEVALSDLKEAQETLIHQEKLRALGEMVSGVAHDFGNLLTPVLVYSEELLDDEGLERPSLSSEERLEILQGIHDAAEDGAALIKRLRASYHPQVTSELSSREAMWREVSLHSLFTSALKLSTPRWPSSLPLPPLTINVDPELKVEAILSELRQALVNLISNAFDAMSSCALSSPHKPLSLTLTGRSERGCVLLEVIDQGEGMPSGVLAQCQKAFFSTKGEAGTGLGLAMVRETIERHKGSLSIHSEHGEGTTVRIKLPLTSRAATSVTAPTARLTHPNPTHPNPTHPNPNQREGGGS